MKRNNRDALLLACRWLAIGAIDIWEALVILARIPCHRKKLRNSQHCCRSMQHTICAHRCRCGILTLYCPHWRTADAAARSDGITAGCLKCT